MKNILIVIVAIIALGGLIWIGRPDAKLAVPVPETSGTGSGILAVMGESKYDFGSISMKNGIVKNTFTIKNDGAEPINLSKMYTSCMCTTATLMLRGAQWGPVGMPGHGGVPPIDQEINPDEEATVEVAFDPAAHGPAGVGRIEREIIIESSGGEPLRFGFSALVTP